MRWRLEPDGTYFIAGFSAMTAGYVTKKNAKIAAKNLGIPQSQIRGVSNRFWRGYMIAQLIDPRTLRVWDRNGDWRDLGERNAA